MLRRFRLRTVFAFCSFVVLVGCVTSDGPIFGVNDAEDVPGIAGEWRQQGSDGTNDLFIRRNSDFTYSSGRSPANYNMQWIGISLGNGYFVAQTANGSAAVLCLVRVRGQNLIVYQFSEATLRSAATAAGLDFAEQKGDLQIPHRNGKTKTLTFFMILARTPDPKEGQIYTRIG